MPLRERLLVLGGAGTGKTYQFLKVLENLPDITGHVIDPDDGFERVWDLEFPHVTNVKYYFTPTWYDKLQPMPGKPNRWVGGLDDAAAKIMQEHKEGDWICLEHMGVQWDMVQEMFTDRVFEKEIGKYFLERRKATKAGATRLEAFEGWLDWPVVKKIHNQDYFWKICFRTKAHLWMTSTLSSVTPSQALKEDPELQNLYSGTLMRVEGEKRIPLKIHTMLLFRGDRNDGWTITTFQKDRGRRWLKNVKLYDFYAQYLVAVAGWS